MTFVDEIILNICSGKGGDGALKWHRNRRIQKGGPAGGDGGKGGDVYLRGVHHIERLSAYSSNPKFKASDGGRGGGNSLEGKDGGDLFIDIPIGSVVTNLQSGETYEVLTQGQQIKILTGGKGGYGNEHFKSSRNVTPMEHTDGKLGICADFKVELQLIAHAGFIGYPNAGKSTLLNTLTNSRAKVGDYAFTTLDPNLGVFGNYILADIPGLIEGASIGKGLGDKFLKHIMRTNILIHCISVERDDIIESYNAIRNELEAYNPELLQKQELLIITKSDLVNNDNLEIIMSKARDISPSVLAISIIDDNQLDVFIKYLSKTLDNTAK